jgi:trehalose 6-phosphate phosphatase
MLGRNFKAIILDIDEVVAQNIEHHATAWKIVFDAYLEQDRQIDYDLKKDFSSYIDQSPKKETVKDFFDLKNIALPEGNPDSVEATTINGLINKENQVFLDLIGREGIDTFQDTVNQIKRWKNRGLKVAIASSVKNTAELIHLAGMEGLLDVVWESDELNIIKPSTEAYSYICEQLQVRPEEAVLIENTVNGVQAGRESNFGLVVGMVRDSKPKRELLLNGADIVVGNMEELKTIGLKKSYNYEIR